MFGSFLAFWIKLRRPALLYGTYAAVAAVAALITTVTFLNATATATAQTGQPGPPGAGVTVGSLAGSAGFLTGLSSSVTLLGIVALCVAAAQLAGEYTTGTLRNLLIRRPQRVQLLGGAWAAIVTFLAGAVAVAGVVAGGVALGLAQYRGIDTTAWFTADGWAQSARTLAETAFAVAGYATFGAVLGLVMRAPVAAIAVGVGWTIAIEQVLAGFISGADRWLPGQLLTAVSEGGTSTITLGTGFATSIGYLALAMAGAAVLFQRRDVSA